MVPLLSLLARLGLLGALLAGSAAAAPVGALRLIGVQTLPRGQEVSGTTVGGLSGLDYDAARDRWVAISDDRSQHGPARAYTLRLDYDAERFRSAAIEDVLILRQPDGSAYPNREQRMARGGEVPDFESVRIDPVDSSLWYLSEGDRALGLMPFLRHAARDGKFIGELALPGQFRFSPDGKTGPRPGLACEGLSVGPDGRSLWVALEGPLFEDGLEPTPVEGAPVRFTRFSRDGEMLAQTAYLLDPLPVAPAQGKYADNAVSEVLATEDVLLVLERSGVQGADDKFRFHVRLYAATIDGATDVRAAASLTGRDFRPMPKRLLADFDRLRAGGSDNLEGLSWGRPLANGHATLVLVSDDNFNATQSTEVWLFEVLPPTAAVASTPSRQWDELFDGVVHDDRRIAGFVGPYRWLSNYLPCPVTYEGRAYGSSEAAYHASKFPEAERDEFTKLDPDASKKLSRRKTVDQAWWDARKERVMREITAAKFAQNPELARRLLETGDRELEELNWWGDKFWGTVKGEGQNVLGKILMDVRADIRTRQK